MPQRSLNWLFSANVFPIFLSKEKGNRKFCKKYKFWAIRNEFLHSCVVTTRWLVFKTPFTDFQRNIIWFCGNWLTAPFETQLFLREPRAELLHSSEKKTTSNSFCLFVTLSGIIHWYSVRKNILRYMVWSCNIWDLQGVEWFLGCAFWPEQTESDILMNIATHIYLSTTPFLALPLQQQPS